MHAILNREKNVRTKEYLAHMKKIRNAAKRKEHLELKKKKKKNKAHLEELHRKTEILWKKNGEDYIEWYHSSFELNKVSAHYLTKPEKLTQLHCNCEKFTQQVDLYMTHCECYI